MTNLIQGYQLRLLLQPKILVVVLLGRAQELPMGRVLYRNRWMKSSNVKWLDTLWSVVETYVGTRLVFLT